MNTRVTRRPTLDNAGADFTADTLDSLLRDLFPTRTLPPRTVLLDFAAKMNMIRANVRTAHELFRTSHANALALQKSASIILTSLRNQREAVARKAEIFEAAAAAPDLDETTANNLSASLARHKKALAAGDRILADLAYIQVNEEWFVQVDEKPKFPDNWTDCLPDIIGASKNLAKALHLGTGKTRGPYLRLLVELIKRTTGQTVSSETIYDHL